MLRYYVNFKKKRAEVAPSYYRHTVALEHHGSLKSNPIPDHTSVLGAPDCFTSICGFMIVCLGDFSSQRVQQKAKLISFC